jgi:hypothetical protein
MRMIHTPSLATERVDVLFSILESYAESEEDKLIATTFYVSMQKQCWSRQAIEVNLVKAICMGLQSQNWIWREK